MLQLQVGHVELVGADVAAWLEPYLHGFWRACVFPIVQFFLWTLRSGHCCVVDTLTSLENALVARLAASAASAQVYLCFPFSFRLD